MIQVQQRDDHTLRVDPSHSVEVGDVLIQQEFIGNTKQLFAKFHELWNPMWNKHAGLGVDHWTACLAQMQECVEPPSVPCELAPLTFPQWISVIKSKKGHSAIGPDGISKADLQHMPQSLQEQLLSVINDIDQDKLRWPQAILQGHISSVEKTSLSSAPGDYRPITVLSMLYRCWSSLRARQLLSWVDHWADAGITGNRPGFSSKSVWWHVASQIEAAYHDGEELSGAITDICKCFNTIPRAVVYGLGIFLGVPKSFMTSWHSAVHSLERRFVIHGQISPAIQAVTGYPEGDPLSVLAMTFVNVYMHGFLAKHSQPCRVLSYVDNWEGTSSRPAMISHLIRTFDAFAELIEVRVDHRKTIGWSTTTEGRKSIAQSGIKVEYACRDLGGHLALCRRHTIFTVHNRISSNHPTWVWLKRSCAPIDQKLKVLTTVCWPRCLHGIENVTLADDHYARLRTMAVQALGWNKKGSSPLIQLGLCVDPLHDPHFFALSTTILTMRHHGEHSTAATTVEEIAHRPPPQHVPGPARVFLEALHELGWRWNHAGALLDHEGLPLQLFHSPIQLIRGRMRHAWHTRITCLMSTRKGFEFMQHVSVDATLASFQRVADKNDGIARTAMDGTFFTNDKLFHMGKVPDQKCTHCEEQDSIYHRYWECPHFQNARQQVPDSCIRELCNSHAVTAERGWLPDIPARLPFLHALNTIPDTTDEFLQSSSPDVLPQHLFTDGSGLWPNHRDRRLVSWGVVKANLSDHTFAVLAMGGVPGLLQTVLRAECVAAIAALKYVLVSKRDTTIWIDNQTVASRLQQALQSLQRVWANKYKDHDLWTQLLMCVHCIKQLGIRVQCVKVRAHQDIAEYPDTVEQWVILGNRAADTAAETALGLLPPHVLAAHRQVVEQSKQQEQLGGYLHGVIHAAGSIAVQSKRASEESQEQRWQQAAHEQERSDEYAAVSFGVDRPLVQAPSTHSMRKCQTTVADWVRSLHSTGETTLQWVSYYHLFLHYLVTTGKPGFYFDRRTRVWETAEELVEEKGFYFLDRCNAFSHCVRCFALVSQLEYHPASRLPAGTLFRCWARCLLLPVEADFVFRLDRIFQRHGVHTIKRAKKDLVAFPQVKGDIFP
eukprot:Skav226555  [mRNA]  locus=scaffold1427:6548:9886:+ [translate_table: standard]